MNAGHMTGLPHGRHRLGVLPGLSSRSESVVGGRVNDITTTLATLDEESGNKQLVPISRPHSRTMNGKTWSALKSRESDESLNYHFHNITSRVSSLEEANKAILEEVYRLQSNARAGDFTKKEILKEEKRVQRELMGTIRSSNDVVAQLTSRLRKAEEKLHQERENLKNLSIHSKKLEQILFSAQKEADTQRDAQNIQTGDMKHRMEDLLRRWEKNDRTSESIIDEFHQLKNKVEIQAMEFIHMQTEIKQRSKRMEDELKQSMQQARFQQDNNGIAEQNNLQLRHLLESRMSETRDAVNELRTRITQTESNGRSQTQQLSVKMTDLQSNISDISHRRQEEMQNLEKTRQEHHHLEENERYKLQNKIQTIVEEMNEKLMQKEVRLREEALQKFVDVEKIFQKEESARMDFEKHLREDVDTRWSMQHKLYVEEIQAMKEIRRNDRSHQVANFKKIDDCIVMLDRKIKYERKAIEKVLLAEITKREVQSRQVRLQLDGVKEQLRVALSTLQEAIGGLQMQTTQNKEYLLNELKTRVNEEQETVARALRDADARFTAITTRITQQEEYMQTRMDSFKQEMKKESNEQLRSSSEWRSITDKDIAGMRDLIKDLPQEIRETQERIGLIKAESETRFSLESEYRMRESESIKKHVHKLLERLEELDSDAIQEKSKHSQMETTVITMQGTLTHMGQLAENVKSNLATRINSETKMRLEETGAIKRDLARLKVDLQPLLWNQNTKSRSFIKSPASFLNEWGIYQCARWYDIKMRWLRLLDRSRNRKYGSLEPKLSSHTAVVDPQRGQIITPDLDIALKPDFSSNPSSPQEDLTKSGYVTPENESTADKPLESEASFTVNKDPRARSVSADQISEYGELPTRDDYANEMTDDELRDRSPKIPEPAWYNKDNVYETDDDNADRNASGEEMDQENGLDLQGEYIADKDASDDYGPTDDNISPQEGSSYHQKSPIFLPEDQSETKNSLPSREEPGSLFESPQENPVEEDKEVSQGESATDELSGPEDPRKISGSSQKLVGSGKGKRASPGDKASSSKPPSRKRIVKPPPVTSRGKSYDMEGSR